MSLGWDRVELEHKERLKELCRAPGTEPDVGKLLAFNDVIAAVPSLASRAIRTLSKLSRDENDQVAVNALLTTDSFVKNCMMFRTQLFSSAFISDLVKSLPKCIRDPNHTGFTLFSHKKLEDLNEETTERYNKVLVFIQSWARLPNARSVDQIYKKLVEAGVVFPAPLPGEQISPTSESSRVDEPKDLRGALQAVNIELFPILSSYLQLKLEAELLHNGGANSTRSRDAPSRYDVPLGHRAAEAQRETLQMFQHRQRQMELAQSSESYTHPPATNEPLPLVGSFTEPSLTESYAVSCSVLEMINACEPEDLTGDFVRDLVSEAQKRLDVLIRDKLSAVGFIERASPSLLTQCLRLKIRLERVIHYASKLIEVVKSSPHNEVHQNVYAEKIPKRKWDEEELAILVEEGLAQHITTPQIKRQEAEVDEKGDNNKVPVSDSNPEFKSVETVSKSLEELLNLKNERKATPEPASTRNSLISPPPPSYSVSTIATEAAPKQKAAYLSNEGKSSTTENNQVEQLNDPFLEIIADAQKAAAAAAHSSDNSGHPPSAFAPPHKLESEPFDFSHSFASDSETSSKRDNRLLDVPIQRQSSFDDETFS